MKYVSPAEAIRAIPDGSVVVFPHGSVEPTRLYAAFEQEVDCFRHLKIYSGLSVGAYPFLRRGLGTNFAYFTWQASPQIREFVRQGKVGFLPIRYCELPRMFSRTGPIPPDVVVIQVSPPEGGNVSLGISAGLHCELVRSARLVIAEVNPNMPVTAGVSSVPVDRIDLAVESEAPILEYRSPRATADERAIVDHVLGLIPKHAWVQLGVGSVPDCVLPSLGDLEGINLLSGVISQGLVEFVQRARHTPKIITGELIGDRVLYDFCHQSKLIQMASVLFTHDIVQLAALPRFVSVNSALEVDLQGQVNAETLAGVQVSGVGGSLDYVEAAAMSDEGMSILAFTSTAENGKRSRIVRHLSNGSVVTVPRYCVDAIVTEYGVARLKGKDLASRADALISIAHPAFRDDLARGTRQGVEGTDATAQVS